MNNSQKAALFSAREITDNQAKRYLARIAERTQLQVGDKVTFPEKIDLASQTLLIDTFNGNAFASVAYSVGETYDPENCDLMGLGNFTRSTIDTSGTRVSCECPIVDRKVSNADNIVALQGKSLKLVSSDTVENQRGQNIRIMKWENA